MNPERSGIHPSAVWGSVVGIVTVLWYVVFLGLWPSGPGPLFMLLFWGPAGSVLAIGTILLGLRGVYVRRNAATILLGATDFVLGLSWFFGTRVLEWFF